MWPARTHHERLSALDASFLALEDANAHMHIGAAAIFEAGPLRTSDGGIDIARIERLVEAGLHRIPRYRQCIARVPLVDHPVWVDDPRFNLHYHLRHTHLPRPGDERQLKRLVGRLMSQQLDRGKPLWEMWVIEGLPDDHFALVTKVHHCMIDGVGSVELVGSVMRPTPEPDPSLDEPPPRWAPRTAPPPAALLGHELLHRASTPWRGLPALRTLVREPSTALARARDTATGFAEVFANGLSGASPSPFNVPIGPHRRFDWLTMDMAAIKAIRARFGGTLNDVVLTVLAGGLRRFLRRRGEQVDGIDFRAMLPVNVRQNGECDAVGNHVAMIVARLPLDAPTPRARLERVIAETRRVKGSHQASGMQALEELSDAGFTSLLTAFSRLTVLSRPFNLVVTNVPGPPFPVYVQGARMASCWPLVPLFENQALGVALLSYDGRLHWGFNADWDALPDLHDLVERVRQDAEALAADAG